MSDASAVTIQQVPLVKAFGQVTMLGSHMGNGLAFLGRQPPLVEVRGEVATKGRLVGDRPAAIFGQAPLVEAFGQVAMGRRHHGNSLAVLVPEGASRRHPPLVEAFGQVALLRRHVGDSPALAGHHPPLIKAFWKRPMTSSLVGDGPPGDLVATLVGQFPLIEAFRQKAVGRRLVGRPPIKKVRRDGAVQGGRRSRHYGFARKTRGRAL